MNILKRLAPLFADTVQVRTVGRDRRGDVVSSGAWVAHKAHISGGQKFKFMLAGQEVTASLKVTFYGSFGLTVEHEFMLPSRYDPQNPSPLNVDNPTDEKGAHHDVVYFR